MGSVLVCVDFSSVTSRLIDTAVALAARRDAKVVLLHVAAPEPDFVGYGVGPDTVRHDVAVELRAEHASLHELASDLRARGVEVEPVMLRGATVETILAQITARGPELVVLGTHGHGRLHHLVVGRVGEAVVRGSPVPLVLVPAR